MAGVAGTRVLGLGRRRVVSLVVGATAGLALVALGVVQ